MKKATWIKVVVGVKLSADLRSVARELVSRFEALFKVQHLYYARYVDLETRSFVITALTNVDAASIKTFFRGVGVKSVKVEVVGTGSLAHAYAYQMVKHLERFDSDAPQDTEFLDVIHWACNMRGLDYLRESRLYTYAAAKLLHQLGHDQDNLLLVTSRLVPQLKKVRKQLQEEARLKTLVKLAKEMAQSPKENPSAAKERGRKQFGPSASGKAPSSRSHPSSLSGRSKSLARKIWKTPMKK